MNQHFQSRYAISNLILRDGSSMPSWAPRYLSYALALDFKGRDLEVLLQIWEHYLYSLVKVYHWLMADDFDSCVKSILSSGKSLGDFLSPVHLAANGGAQYLVE